MKMKVGFFDVACFVQICSCVCFHVGDRDYYAILNVGRSAISAEIRKAHKYLMTKLHPDKNKCDPQAHEKAVLLNEAYKTLTDNAKRHNYNNIYPKAGLYTIWPYDWEIPECSEKNMDASFNMYTTLIRNKVALGTQWILGIAVKVALRMRWILGIAAKVIFMKGEKDKSLHYGIFLAVTASFVSTYMRPVIVFILLWIVVVDRLHFILMIWMSTKYIKNLRMKYVPYLILIWLMYLSIVDRLDRVFRLDLSFRTDYFLYQFPTLMIIYCTASILVTTHIFLKYKPHQIQSLEFIMYFLQQALAFNYFSEAMPHEKDSDVLLYFLTVIIISKLFFKLVWVFVKPTLHELYAFSRGICEKISAFILSTSKKIVQASIRTFGCVQINARMLALCVQEIRSKCVHICVRTWTTCVQISLEMRMKCVHICHHLPDLSVTCGKYIYNRLKPWFQSLISSIRDLSHFLKTKIMQQYRFSDATLQSRQLLSNAEYVMEGRFYTQAQLNQLRLDCQGTRFNAWRVATILSDVRRFSNFVLGEPHVTAAETEEHRRSSHVYPRFDPDASDSESSSESDQI